jgi:hypothetical protein
VIPLVGLVRPCYLDRVGVHMDVTVGFAFCFFLRVHYGRFLLMPHGMEIPSTSFGY